MFFRFRVKSEYNEDVSYIVKIVKKGILSKNYKNDAFKNFLYKCECPAKKVVIFKNVLYFISLEFLGKINFTFWSILKSLSKYLIL